MFDEFKIKLNEPVWHDTSYELWGRTYSRDLFNRAQRQQLLEFLRRPDVRQPVAIIGERRAGKTSILKYLVNQLQKEFILLGAPTRGIHTAQEFYVELWSELQLTVASPTSLQGDAEQMRRQLMHEMSRISLKSDGRKPFLLWLDELDAIVEQENMDDREKEKILGFLLHLTARANFPVRLIYSSTHAFPKSKHIRSSPLVTGAQLAFMAPFSQEDAKEMIESMLEEGGSWQAVKPYWNWDIFCRLSGCWPYYMKILLLHLAKSWKKQERISKEDWWRTALTASISDLSLNATLQHLYQKHFSPDEKSVLLWMTRTGGRLSNSSLRSTSPALLSAADRLEQRFYLSSDDESRTFRVELIRHWLADRHDLSYG